MCADIRPVFPEERLLLEILAATPFEYKDKTVWASNNRYYIDGNPKTITKSYYTKHPAEYVSRLLAEHKNQNDYTFFNGNIRKFRWCHKQVVISIILPKKHVLINVPTTAM
jgi:phosphoadenosine phosphosulfate reductase